MNRLELRGVSKKFVSPDGEALWSNRDIDLSFEEAKIHAIVGENGAGKSTLMKTVYGMHTPTSGEILLRGKKAVLRSPRDAIALGIGMVHQHFMLSGPHFAWQNAVLGQEPLTNLKTIDRVAAVSKLTELSRTYKMEVDWNAHVEDLSVGVQQRVEILKLLYRSADLLILDEPTAVLAPQEIAAFFENLRLLKSQGKTILIITHKLKEVMEISDTVTVLKGGRVTGVVPTSQATVEKLAEWMVGRPIERVETGDQNEIRVSTDAGNEIQIEGLTLKPGQILGIAGVEGNGQRELAQKAIEAARGKGLTLGIIPEDRHAMGICLDWDLTENFLIGHQRDPKFARKQFDRMAIDRETTKSIKEFDVRPADPKVKAHSLSGGNQQKFIIARELFHSPKVLVISQPTRGVDIGAIEQIHKKIIAARNQGASILLISSELEEILALSDRIAVLFKNRVVAEMPRRQANEEVLGRHMLGLGDATA